MKTKNIILLLLLFVMINLSVYVLTEWSKQSKIDLILEDNIEMLTTHYKILNEMQRIIGSTVYQSTKQMSRVIEIIAEANSASTETKAKLREEFHKLLQNKYALLVQKGVFQYHFVLKNSESFYRAHKPSKFGDNLNDIRADYRYVNETQKPIRGFSQGKITHGFRNTFPLFDKSGTHIGAMEVSFSSTSLQRSLNNVSNIHTHFIIDKAMFDTNEWKSDGLALKYEQSAEKKNYMISLGTIHTRDRCIDDNMIKLQPISQEIGMKMSMKKVFALYVNYKDIVEVISFFPIQNIEKQTIAWIVSYEESPTIEYAQLSSLIIRVVTFFMSLLIIYFLVKQILSRDEMKNQHKLLNDILNSTDNIMFVTDFKDIKYTNNRFKDLLNIKETQKFNSMNEHNLLNIFVTAEGYLHKELLKDEESFISLIARTSRKDRVVSIVDKNFEPRAFQISISKSDNSTDYLVTLADITKIKEYQVLTEKKAYLDTLTKVYNRNKFDEIFEEELINAQKNVQPLSIAIIDIDKFKNFNDNYGHLIGDEVLISMAQMVNSNVRTTDTFARWGGEEFVILFKNTQLEIAEKISLKLKDKIAQGVHPVAGGITASFGVTEYLQNDTKKTLFKRCDDALYIAKDNGRNRVEVL